MLVGVADTHTVVWYLSHDKRLSARAESFLNQTAQHGDQVGIASITLVELVYLIERYRIPVESFTSLAVEIETDDSVFVEIPLTLPVVRSLSRIDGSLIPEMPDRIIAATAYHLNVPVITRDTRIRDSGMQVVW